MNKNKAQIYLPGLGLNQHLVLVLEESSLLWFYSNLSFHLDSVRRKFTAIQKASIALSITHVPRKPARSSCQRLRDFGAASPLAFLFLKLKTKTKHLLALFKTQSSAVGMLHCL